MPRQFITDNPGVIALIVGLLFSSLIGFVGWWFRVIRSKLISHIESEEKNLIPSFHAKMNDVEKKLTTLHIENLKRFSVLDKRLSIIEDKTKSSMVTIIATLDKIVLKLEKADRNG